jgi:hypothetical protein
MGSPEHMNGEVPELGHGKEASMLFVAGSGRASGPEVCAFTIWWALEAVWLFIVVPETFVRDLFFSFRKGLVGRLVS